MCLDLQHPFATHQHRSARLLPGCAARIEIVRSLHHIELTLWKHIHSLQTLITASMIKRDAHVVVKLWIASDVCAHCGFCFSFVIQLETSLCFPRDDTCKYAPCWNGFSCLLLWCVETIDRQLPRGVPDVSSQLPLSVSALLLISPCTHPSTSIRRPRHPRSQRVLEAHCGQQPLRPCQRSAGAHPRSTRCQLRGGGAAGQQDGAK